MPVRPCVSCNAATNPSLLQVLWTNHDMHYSIWKSMETTTTDWCVFKVYFLLYSCVYLNNSFFKSAVPLRFLKISHHNMQYIIGKVLWSTLIRWFFSKFKNWSCNAIFENSKLFKTNWLVNLPSVSKLPWHVIHSLKVISEHYNKSIVFSTQLNTIELSFFYAVQILNVVKCVFVNNILYTDHLIWVLHDV